MRLYPKVIPVISRETIQQLMQDGDIEVEPMRIADAEMDLSAIMREYLTNEERVNQATREALERRGYDYSKFNQVKREMADVRGFKMGDEGIEYVINQMIEFLLISRNVEEVFAADNVLRQKIFAVMKKHLDVDDEIDREARARLKHLQEGTTRLRHRVQQDGRADPPRPRPDLSPPSRLTRGTTSSRRRSPPPLLGVVGRPDRVGRPTRRWQSAGSHSALGQEHVGHRRGPRQGQRVVRCRSPLLSGVGPRASPTADGVEEAGRSCTAGRARERSRGGGGVDV